jgi:hypothetical protein
VESAKTPLVYDHRSAGVPSPRDVEAIEWLEMLATVRVQRGLSPSWHFDSGELVPAMSDTSVVTGIDL